MANSIMTEMIKEELENYSSSWNILDCQVRVPALIQSNIDLIWLVYGA
jgi:hypothetical protein